jgi:hypothetical protein
MKALASLFVIVMLGAGCASTSRGASQDTGAETVSITIENDSRAPVVVLLARDGGTGERLGRVPAMARRTFHLTSSLVRGPMVLYSVPGDGPMDTFDVYTTAPFRTHGAQEVRWVITEGARTSRVTLR